MVNSKRKGAEGERELSRIFKSRGYETRRGQQYCGANGDPDVVGLPRIYIECKRVENLSIYPAIEKVCDECPEGRVPAVFHRRNRKEWLVTMRLDDWFEIYEGGNDDERGKIGDPLCDAEDHQEGNR